MVRAGILQIFAKKSIAPSRLMVKKRPRPVFYAPHRQSGSHTPRSRGAGHASDKPCAQAAQARRGCRAETYCAGLMAAEGVAPVFFGSRLSCSVKIEIRVKSPATLRESDRCWRSQWYRTDSLPAESKWRWRSRRRTAPANRPSKRACGRSWRR